MGKDQGWGRLSETSEADSLFALIIAWHTNKLLSSQKRVQKLFRMAHQTHYELLKNTIANEVSLLHGKSPCHSRGMYIATEKVVSC